MRSYYPVNWFDDFMGVAYRYYDLRMNVVPLFSERKPATDMWYNTIHWWMNPSIRIRFVEEGDKYWFIMGSESQKPANNVSFFKIIPYSKNYERFKHGHDGEAYLRLGIYAKHTLADAKKDEDCDCGHEARDHDEDDNDVCLFNDCNCKKFSSFQVTLLKKKKTVTDILFLDMDEIKEDPLAWNCVYAKRSFG